MEVLTGTDEMTARAGRPCGAPRPAFTLRAVSPTQGPSIAERTEMDEIVEAKALLLRDILHAVSRLMPAHGILQLKDVIAAWRAEAARYDTRQAFALVAAYDDALADLSVAGPDVVTDPTPPGRRH